MSKSEWVIHVWGKKRDSLELTFVEKFHMDMLRRYQNQQMKFDKILINIAMDDINDKKLFNFLKKEIGGVLVNKNVEFHSCQNDEDLGEYVTFRPYVFDRIGEDVNIFYSHFKGYKSYLTILRESYPSRISDMCEMYWSFMMYEYSMNFDDVMNKLKSHSVYCWFLLKDKTYMYYDNYQKILLEDYPELEKHKEDELCKHSPGSFVWYNMKRLGDVLNDKIEIRNISIDKLNKDNTTIYTHFCELFLMQFLKENDCYTPDVINKDDWDKVSGALYVNLYPYKKVGRELIPEFEKYLIENKMI